MNIPNKTIIEQKLAIFEQAVASLEESVNAPIDVHRFVIDSTIQRFEYTFELAWKTLKVILFETLGIEATAPRAVIREAFQQRLIVQEEPWIDMLRDRNETSHTYNSDIADKIYSDIKNEHFAELKKTLLLLQTRFAKN